MINRLFIKVIIILIIVAFSIPTLLMIYGDFKTMPEPEFDESNFSALVTLKEFIRSTIMEMGTI